MFKKLTQAGGSTGQILHLSSPSFVVSIILFGQRAEALIDTGASVSCIKSARVPQHLNYLGHTRNLLGADGNVIPSRGLIPIPFSLLDRQFTHDCQLLDKLLYDVILGLDFLTQYKATIVCHKQLLLFNDFTPTACSNHLPVASAVINNPSPGKIDALMELSGNLNLSVPTNQYLVASEPINALSRNSDFRLSVNCCNAFSTANFAGNGDGVSQVLATHYPNLLVFNSGCAKIPPIDFWLTDTTPIRQNPRRKAFVEKDVIDKEVRQMLDMGVIRPSHSPWSSPVHIVPKKDGTNRFCIDYRKVNQRVVADAYPLPFTRDLIDSLAGAKVFSTLDLAKGYWQFPLSESAKSVTAFVTADGLYEFNVLPFGICVAPAIFQRVLNRCLAGLPFARVYIDDIIVYSQSIEQHRAHLLEVFDRLVSYNLVLNVKKCQFFKCHVQFLGFTVTPDGIQPNNDKIDSVLKLAAPKSKKEVQEFLGFVNFYRDFCPGMAEKAACLYDLVKKDVEFQWQGEHESAFRSIIDMLTSPPLLAIPDMQSPFFVSTDASSKAVGVVLFQKQGGAEQPVAYASRVLKDSERKYSVIEKELLAIIFGLKRFRYYLLGRKFTLYTDHNPLQHISSLKDSYGRIGRWTMYLQDYQFDVVYRPGRSNGNADALSRCPTLNTIFVDSFDEDYGRLVRSESLPQSSPYARFASNLCVHDHKVWFGARGFQTECIPKQNRARLLSNIHGMGHFGINKTFKLVRSVAWWPNLYRDVASYVKACLPCQRRKPPTPSQQPSTLPQHFTAVYPLECVAWDVMGPLPESNSGNRFVLVIVDIYSRWTEAYPLTDSAAETIAEAFYVNFIARFGSPKRLHSDLGPNLNARVVHTLCDVYEIDRSHSVPYYPQGNGVVERLNRVLQDIIAKRLMDKDSRDWDKELPAAVFAYNVSPHVETKCSPYFLFFNREACISSTTPKQTDDRPLLLKRYAILQDVLTKNCEANNHSENHVMESFHVGDRVLLHRPHMSNEPKKFSLPWRGPYVVTAKVGRSNFTLEVNGRSLVVNGNQLKHYVVGALRLPGRIFKPRIV